MNEQTSSFHSPEPTLDPELERQLAELLAELMDRMQRGEPVQIEEVVRRHPQLEREIRDLWRTVQLADELASIDDLDETPDETPTAGLTLPMQLGDYNLTCELGRGGMGVVYQAEQLSLRRVVAVKMVLQGELASDVDLARFRAEAESAARLDHPNIVPVYEVGEQQGRPFFSMKFVEGSTLAKRLRDGPLPGREAAQLMLPVCKAIAHAHSKGVLHRDLKPSNILLDDHGIPYVSDFGLAKRMQASGSLTGSGVILGTPGYMAPEQVAGGRGEIGPGTDVYGLGAVIYHMLTGRPPFQAASPIDTLLMSLEQDPPAPRLLNSKIDPDLELITLKCLQKPADLRYLDVESLASDLRAYINNETISARETSLRRLLSQMLRQTHHAALLENWGVLWMWHALVLLVLCIVTNLMQRNGVNSPQPFLLLWTIGLGTWASMFWALRRRRGPITFVERQIAHVWAGSVAAAVLLYVVEILLGLPVLTLSPVLGLTSGMVFLVKAGILSGEFYLQAAALFATSALMAFFPTIGLTLFGVVSFASFFFPGLKYYRESAR